MKAIDKLRMAMEMSPKDMKRDKGKEMDKESAEYKKPAKKKTMSKADKRTGSVAASMSKSKGKC